MTATDLLEQITSDDNVNNASMRRHVIQSMGHKGIGEESRVSQRQVSTSDGRTFLVQVVLLTTDE
jgi:hypothetical protein